jgi:apolipoprotein N-acyltransferase
MKFIDYKILQTRYIKYIIAALCGILTALPMIVPQLFFIAWISLIPFLYSLFIIKRKFRSYFTMFLTFGFCYFGIIYTWFFSLHPLDWQNIENGRSILIVITLWLAISVAQGLEYSLMGIVFFATNSKGFHKVLSTAFIWVIIESVVELGTWGMPWGRLAAGQYLFLPFIQSSSLFGSLFVSFLIVMMNGLGAFAIMNRHKKKTWRYASIAAAAILVCNTLFGIIRVAVLDNTPDETVKVAAIQGNLPSDEKWKNEGSNAFDVFINLSVEAAEQGAKIIVWPESAVPVSIIDNDYYNNEYKEFAESHNVYLIVGGFLPEEDKLYSSLIIYTPEGESGISNAYKKRHLVPFGEYVPYREFLYDILPFVGDFRMLDDDLTQGSDTVLFDTEYGKISGLICFDSIFPRFSYEDVREGSQLIVMGTNDSYFRTSQNPRQHMSHSVLRAAENGRYIVRAANTGISCVIAPNGRIISQSEMNNEEIIISDIYFRSAKTLYTITGDIIILIAVMYIISVGVYFNANKIKYYNNQ